MAGNKKTRKGFTRFKDIQQIKTKIQLSMIIVLIISLTVLGTTAAVLNYSSTVGTLNQTLKEAAFYIGERVSKELACYKLLAYETGTDARLSDTSVSIEEKLQLVSHKVQRYNMTGCALLNQDGINVFNNIDCSSEEYYKQAYAGNVYVSEPSLNNDTGKISMIISAPLWKNGIPDSEVVGVVMYIPQENFLNDIMSNISISKTSAAYMIDKNGYTIADNTIESIRNKQHIEQEAISDSSLKALAKLHGEMRSGGRGFGFYKINGINKFLAYAPVSGTDGWSIGVSAYTSDFLSSTLGGILFTIIILIISVLAGAVVALQIGKSIGNPVKLCTDRLRAFGLGDLHSEVPQIDKKDETGVLAQTTQKLTNELSAVIKDMDYMLTQISAGNFTVHSQNEEFYRGDFKNLLVSMKALIKKLSSTMRDINSASNQVALGSVQLAENAQLLADGATDQAGTVEELTATIENITSLAQTNAKKVADAHSQAEAFAEKATISSHEMLKLTQAMEHINDASKKIEDIITEIEDIASQTNLLSLNASIEAARAGEAGRGFAVVADQIGKLASDSAVSAVHTRELIQKSIEEIEHGNQIMETTSVSLHQVIDGIKLLSNLSQESSAMSISQAEAMKQIEQGIEQISVIVQNNSGSAQETSATSEELSAQSENLKELVARFQLADQDLEK